jgi:nucleotidyltransferase substrate binding protein (TIGR01987 family)
MNLDLTPFSNAIDSLDEVILAESQKKGDEFLRDACIKRFEYCYEITWKMLKRYLEVTSAAQETIDALAFSDLIRTGSEQGLLKNDWSVWKIYRDARNATAHAYNEKKAKEVFAIIPDFLSESRFLLDQLKTRQAA